MTSIYTRDIAYLNIKQVISQSLLKNILYGCIDHIINGSLVLIIYELS